MKIFLLSLCAALALAQDKPAAPAPILTAEQRAAFWRATLEKTKADSNYDAAVQSMAKSCDAAGQVLMQDPRGEPACAPKPAPSASPAAKK